MGKKKAAFCLRIMTAWSLPNGLFLLFKWSKTERVRITIRTVLATSTADEVHVVIVNDTVSQLFVAYRALVKEYLVADGTTFVATDLVFTMLADSSKDGGGRDNRHDLLHSSWLYHLRGCRRDGSGRGLG